MTSTFSRFSPDLSVVYLIADITSIVYFESFFVYSINRNRTYSADS